ncbi:unnamed protein product [Parnassius apollo]|uniref:(apollo) hypothetical protein n=1 Tax=Parnassius apollo TaxID=110799 RepID=A0A8S3WHZ2_PARAO|nr:unnamed protein product [Parnassius apollo]
MATVCGPYYTSNVSGGKSTRFSSPELIITSISDMRPLLKSREEANRELAAQSEQSEDEISVPSTRSSSSRSKKPSRLDKLEQGQRKLENMLEQFIKSFQPEDHSYSGSEKVSTSPDPSEDEKNAPQLSVSSPKPCEPSTSLVNEDFDWTPTTRQQEPLIPTPSQHIATQGTECQRLGDISFSQIRYAEVQKKLHASPVFGSLKVNPILTTYGPIQSRSIGSNGLHSGHNFPCGGATLAICRGLEERRRTIKHLTNNKRIHYPLCQKAPANAFSPEDTYKVRNKKFRFRDPDPNTAEGNRKFLDSDRFLVNYVSSSKTQRQSTTDNQSERPKQILYPEEIQVVKPLQSTSFLTNRRFSHENRHFSGIFSHPNNQSSSKIPVNSSPKQDSTIYMPTVWSINGTSNLRKSVKLDSITIKTDEHKSYCIPRRLLACQQDPVKVQNDAKMTVQFLVKLGWIINVEKSLQSRANRVSRNRMGHNPQYKSAPEKENIFREKRSQQDPNKSKMELAIRKKPARKTKLCFLCNTLGKTSLQGDTKISQHFARRVSPEEVSHSKKSIPTMPVVDSKTGRERQYSFQVLRNHFHYIRCLRQRMGSADKRKAHQRYLEHLPISVAYQQERTICSNSSNSFRERFNKKQKSCHTIEP